MTVVQWTGREARLLRRAMRLGQREFAAMLGISHTAVANYERPNRRDTIRLRHETQQMLDTVLARAGEEVRDRFQAAVAADRDPFAHVRGGREGPGPGSEGVVMMLLSHEARFVTGQRIVVNGGQHMW